MPTLTEQALAQVTPSQFHVGATFDGKYASGGVTYNRSWKNGWGATAYARAYWYDQPIIPTDKWGYAIGVDVVKEFKR